MWKKSDGPILLFRRWTKISFFKLFYSDVVPCDSSKWHKFYLLVNLLGGLIYIYTKTTGLDILPAVEQGKTTQHTNLTVECKNLSCVIITSPPPPPLHNTCRHLIDLYHFLSLVSFFYSPCTHQTDNIIMSILHTVKTFCASSNKGKEMTKQTR